MLETTIGLWLALATLAPPAASPSPAPARKPPKLVVMVVIDQFRYDYLTRFRADYTGGLRRLLEGGAVFTQARYRHFPTVTAIGHSTLVSGALPSVSGIIGNDWWERGTGRSVTSVFDPAEKIVGGGGEGVSPRRMLVSTVGDELKSARPGSRVIGLSLKDRSAVLPAGHMGDLALWYDQQTGRFVSSTFYVTALPEWVSRFEGEHLVDSYRGQQWAGGELPREAGPAYYGAVYASPFGNDLLEALAERAVEAERLGQRGETDLLSVSFSSNDAVGHDFGGPDSPPVHDVSVRTDQALRRFFEFLDARVGLADVLVVLTADHGVAPSPDVQAKRRMPGGRMAAGSVRQAVQNALGQGFGEGTWVVGPSDHSIYLDRKLVADKKLDLSAVQDAARDAAEAVPHVLRAYALHDLLAGRAGGEGGRILVDSANAQRTADVQVLLEPYWMFVPRGTTHGSVYGYDTHVPVIFMGPWIRAGTFREPISVNDVAPTLADILGVETPSGSSGRVLDEVLAVR